MTDTPGIATLDFFESSLGYNNLGGMGPIYDDPHELRFVDLGKTPSGGFAVDLRITNQSEYYAFRSSNNGLAGQFANINILGNTNVKYEFCFLYSERPPAAPHATCTRARATHAHPATRARARRRRHRQPPTHPRLPSLLWSRAHAFPPVLFGPHRHSRRARRPK